MSKARPLATAAILAAIVAMLADRWPVDGPSTAALQVTVPGEAPRSLGTDDAFVVSGFEPRENLIGGGALRWTRPKAYMRFDSVGPGLVTVDLTVRDHRTDVTITANGATIGNVPVGSTSLTSQIRVQGRSLLLGIETEGFATSSGRVLGTQFVSLQVRPDPGNRDASHAKFWLAFVGVLIAAMVAQWSCRLHSTGAVLAPLFLIALVLPAGLWRSPWLLKSAVLLGVVTILSALVARVSRGSTTTRTALQMALATALTVHGVLPPSPAIVQGDVQLHGNKLAEVAHGNLFPVTRTDHKPPFVIPYGFSFYGLLAPFDSPDANVSVVRNGAAFFSAVSIALLAFAVGRTSAGLAASAVILWTAAPVNIRTMAFGNLNNVFAQAIFVLFLTGALLMSPGRARSIVLTLLVLLSATAHLSSFVVLVVLLFMALVLRDRSNAAFKPLLAGVLLAGAYYATFLPLILGQLPRLLGERGGSGGRFDPLRLPTQIALGLGWPWLALLVLAFLTSRIRTIVPLSRSQVATAGLLALAALISPIEVRYLLAVAPLLAIVGASSMVEAAPAPTGFPRQDLPSVFDFRWLRWLNREAVATPLAALLLLAAIALGGSVLMDFVPLWRG